ncbi:MAG TPA: hypothetical protein ACN46N_07525 [Prochlorococcus sp.]
MSITMRELSEAVVVKMRHKGDGYGIIAVLMGMTTSMAMVRRILQQQEVVA